MAGVASFLPMAMQIGGSLLQFSGAQKAAGAAEAEASARCSSSWLGAVGNMKFEPVTCVHGRRLCARMTASHGSNLYAIMAYAAVHVPA